MDKVENCIICGKKREEPFAFCKECMALSEEQRNKFMNIDYNERNTDYYNYKNHIMCHENMHRLFIVDGSGRDEQSSSRYDVFINTLTGIPYVKMWHFSGATNRSGGVEVNNPKAISYYLFLLYAMKHSEETFNKYKGINEDNWVDYIIDEI